MSIFENLPEEKKEKIINLLAESLWQRVKPILDEKIRRKALERTNKKDM